MNESAFWGVGFNTILAKQRIKNNRYIVKANKGFSLIGYTKMDLGIAKYHFEVAVGKEILESIQFI